MCSELFSSHQESGQNQGMSGNKDYARGCEGTLKYEWLMIKGFYSSAELRLIICLLDSLKVAN